MRVIKPVTNVPNINYYEHRDHLFFNKYKYRARINIPGIFYTLDRSSSETLTFEQYKLKIEKIYRMSVIINTSSVFYKEIEDNYKNLEKFLQWKKVNKRSILIRLSYSSASIFSNKLSILVDLKKSASIFSNNLSILVDLKKLYDDKRINDPYTVEVDITEARPEQKEPNVKYFTSEPKYKYRVYLKSTRVEITVLTEFYKMLKKHKKLHPSKSLIEWLRNQLFDKHRKIKYYPSIGKYAWCKSSFLINYNDESLLSFLSLTFGEIIGKRYRLEKCVDYVK